VTEHACFNGIQLQVKALAAKARSSKLQPHEFKALSPSAT
jgi:hypothetical protein